MIGRYWRMLPYETRAALAIAAVGLLIGAGFFAAAGVTSLETSAPDGNEVDVRAETLTVERVVERVITAKGPPSRTVVRTVRVVPRVRKSAGVLGTSVELRTVTAPGRRDLVTLPAQVRTVVKTRRGRTRTSVVTNDRVVTDRRVVTSERVVTNTRIVTNQRVVTDVLTQQITVPVTTVRTVTDTVPTTQTVTTTAVLTETVVPPPATVTVTVTCPPRGCG